MMGAGITSCVQFGMEYIKNPEVVERIYFSWAQGYMSQRNAMQMLLDATQRDLRGWQIDDQKKKLRTFCSENPHLAPRAQGGKIGSALGQSGQMQSKTSCPLYPKSDIDCVFRHVCFGPIADIRFSRLTATDYVRPAALAMSLPSSNARSLSSRVSAWRAHRQGVLQSEDLD